MSAYVRRLTLDPAPQLQTWVSLFLWLVVGLYAALWMTGHGISALMMVFSASASTLTFAVKVPVWRTLPLSRAALGRAQWWYLWGRPYIMAILTTAVAAAVVAILGDLHVGWADLAAFVGAEMSLLCLVAVVHPLVSVLNRAFGGYGSLAGFGLPFGAALGLAFMWGVGADFTAARPGMWLGGGVALAVALVGYGLSPWMPLAQNRPLNFRDQLQEMGRPDGAAAPVRRTPAGGLAVFSELFQRAARIVPLMTLLAGGGGFLGGRSVSGGLGSGALPLGDMLLFAPLMGAMGTMTVVSVVSQRVLAGLPLTAWSRTVALQATTLAVQLPLALVIVGAVVFFQPLTVSTQWLFGLLLAVLGSCVLPALALPATLRFGAKGPVLIMLGGMVAAGAVVGLFVSLGRDAARLAALGEYGMGLILMAVFLVLLCAGWLWTWLEIAYGRAAYRQWTWIPMSWRGQ